MSRIDLTPVLADQRERQKKLGQEGVETMIRFSQKMRLEFPVARVEIAFMDIHPSLDETINRILERHWMPLPEVLREEFAYNVGSGAFMGDYGGDTVPMVDITGFIAKDSMGAFKQDMLAASQSFFGDPERILVTVKSVHDFDEIFDDWGDM